MKLRDQINALLRQRKEQLDALEALPASNRRGAARRHPYPLSLLQQHRRRLMADKHHHDRGGVVARAVSAQDRTSARSREEDPEEPPQRSPNGRRCYVKRPPCRYIGIRIPPR